LNERRDFDLRGSEIMSKADPFRDDLDWPSQLFTYMANVCKCAFSYKMRAAIYTVSQKRPTFDLL